MLLFDKLNVVSSSSDLDQCRIQWNFIVAATAIEIHLLLYSFIIGLLHSIVLLAVEVDLHLQVSKELGIRKNFVQSN